MTEFSEILPLQDAICLTGVQSYVIMKARTPHHSHITPAPGAKGVIMFGMIVTILVGLVCIGLGISHTLGNISTLHSYHRNRVKPEDIPAFGKVVGTGTILIGIGIVIYGALTAATLVTGQPLYTQIGNGVMIGGLVIGLGISFWGMKKYNGGMF